MMQLKKLDLAAFLLASLFVVGTAVGAEGAASMRLAVFRCDATPPLGSKIYDGKFTTVEQPLAAKGVVLDDGRSRYVLCALDWRWLRGPENRLFRRKLAEATGADLSHVAVQCVHQHTAPSSAETEEDFFDKMTDRVAAAAKRSLNEMQPFDSIGTGQTRVERVASNRRIVRKDGTVRNRFSSTKKSPELRAAPEGLIDPYLKTITFASGKKPLARLHYYATHPQSFYKDGRVSIDFVGMARERWQEKEGVPQIYFTGCAGDIGAGKYNDGSRRARAELEERLYRAMAASSATTQLEPVGKITWRTVKLSQPWDDRTITSASGGKIIDERVVGLIETSSLQMGDVHILNLPGEPFVAYQLYAQELMLNSFVATTGLGDGNTGYIPTAQAASEGGYGVRVSPSVASQEEAALKKAIRDLLGVK